MRGRGWKVSAVARSAIRRGRTAHLCVEWYVADLKRSGGASRSFRYIFGGGRFGGFALFRKQRDERAAFESLETGHDRGCDEFRAGQIRVIMIAVKLVHCLASHGLVLVRAEIREIKHGNAQLPANIFRPWSESPIAGAALDLILPGIVVGR